MNSSSVSNPSLTRSLSDSLEALPGVERAYFDPRHRQICLLSRPGWSADQLRADALRTVAAEVGEAADAIPIEVVSRLDPAGRQRVRFDGIDVEERPDRRIHVRVRLEWDGRTCEGEAEGEPGETIELRTAIAAGLQAIERITGRSLGLRLVGVKRVRAFDAELMVVSLYRAGSPPEKLVGAVLAGDDAHRAAAIALLNALNRLLGNYLVTH